MIRASLEALSAEFNLSREAQEKLARVSRFTVERMLSRERKRHKPGELPPPSQAPSSNTKSPSEPSGIGRIKNPVSAILILFPTMAVSLRAIISSP
jgi:hypothetical protein